MWYLVLLSFCRQIIKQHCQKNGTIRFDLLLYYINTSTNEKVRCAINFLKSQRQVTIEQFITDSLYFTKKTRRKNVALKRFHNYERNIIINLCTNSSQVGIRLLIQSFLSDDDLFNFVKIHPLVYEYHRYYPFLLQRVFKFVNLNNMVNKVYLIQKLTFHSIVAVTTYARFHHYWIFSKVNSIESMYYKFLDIIDLSENPHVTCLNINCSLNLSLLPPNLTSLTLHGYDYYGFGHIFVLKCSFLSFPFLKKLHLHSHRHLPTNFLSLCPLLSTLILEDTDTFIENLLPSSITELHWLHPPDSIINPNVLPVNLKHLVVGRCLALVEQNLPISIESIVFQCTRSNHFDIFPFPNGIECFPNLKCVHYKSVMDESDGWWYSYQSLIRRYHDAIRMNNIFIQRNSKRWWISQRFPQIMKRLNFVYAYYIVEIQSNMTMSLAFLGIRLGCYRIVIPIVQILCITFLIYMIGLPFLVLLVLFWIHVWLSPYFQDTIELQ